MGNSLVEDDTRSAVDTEFGRGYRWRRPAMTNGEKGLEVRNRMLRWNANVDKAHRITRHTDELLDGFNREQ
jgi:hypothetical protein